MSATQPLGATNAQVVPLAARRPARWVRPRQAMKVAAAFAFCVFALIGSIADSAIARSGILAIGSDGDSGNFQSLAITLAWAAVANIAVCAGVAILVYWFFARPSADIVELRPSRRMP